MRFGVAAASVVLLLAGCAEPDAPAVDASPDSQTSQDLTLPPEPVPTEIPMEMRHSGTMRLGACHDGVGGSHCANAIAENDGTWTWGRDGDPVNNVARIDVTMAWTDDIPDGGASMQLHAYVVAPDGTRSRIGEIAGVTPLQLEIPVPEWVPGSHLFFDANPFIQDAPTGEAEIGRGQRFDVTGTVTVIELIQPPADAA